MKQFTLPVKGLSLGRSSFKYEIGNEFFEHFENSEIEKANIQLILEIEKQSRMLVLDFKIHGKIQTQCDRCLDEFDLEIENHQKLYVKTGNEESNENDDMIIIAENEHEFNIAQFIYEFVNLSLPIKKVHGNNKEGKSLCNNEMLNKLKNYSVNDDKKIDPRWDKLKDLM